MVLLAWLLYGVLYSQRIVNGERNSSCFDNCKCCLDGKCRMGIHNWPNVCTDGCIDGHRGARCYELCQYENCKSCGAQTTSKDCDACYDGYFLGTAKDCTSVCPPSCKSCTSSTHCNKCKSGFYNKPGQTACESSYCPEHCQCSVGQDNCISCKAGYFNKSASCNSTCPTNCVDCISKESCSKCNNGFYNGYEHDSGVGLQLNNCTFQCPKACSKCNSYNNCSQCVTGTYGLACQKNCSVGCVGGTCLIETGNCTCLNGFTGSKCSECVESMFGKFCNLSCPVHCKEGKCDRTSGECISGCILDAIIGKTCDKCIRGMYGELCNKACDDNCKNKNCERYNHTCSDGCESNFFGTYCDQCIPGKYGQNCGLNCPDTCTDRTCEKSSGNCNTCVENYDGPKCDYCKLGYFGLNCKDTCSPYCIEKMCDKDNGVCINGCVDGSSGDKCCLKNENCLNCSSITDCKKCVTGFYQRNCTAKCPENCLDSCDFSTGKCAGCKADYFGKFCNLTCSRNCSLSHETNIRQCEQSSGSCLFECVKGLYGLTCNETCSRSCVNNTCLRDSGKCTYGCVAQQGGPSCIQSSEQTSKTNNVIGPVAGGVGAVCVLAAVSVVAAVLFRRRRMTKNTNEGQRNNANDKGAQERHETAAAAKEGPVYANISEKEQNGHRDDIDRKVVGVEDVKIDEQTNEDVDDDYYNCDKKHFSVKVSNLFSYVTGRESELFEKEFKNLPKPDDLSKVCRIAKKPENIALNRYNGIYPFDHSRVTIASQPKFFINACYIDGYNREKAYIASFGPTAKTTDHFKNFWCMVWHEKSDVIVMLTNLHEESGMKCEQYWPDADTEIHFDQVKVKCRSVEEFAEYTVRTFTVSKGKEHRNLTQLHFTAWPDKGVPSEVTSLIEFRQRVKAVPVALDGPIIVHCSAGVGRTGTYIALDILTEQGQAEDSIDVFGCVSKMRGQRVTMVQTAEQYKFLHKALVHSLTFECEAVPAERLESLVFEADDVFTRMFQTLKKEIDTETEENVVAREENRRRFPDKSRRHSDIPGNRARVRLYLSRKSGDYDFINAVFISSFKTRNLFIAAQTPLPSTVDDFLCMIYQQSASCVVALESPESSSRRSDVGKYLPADNESYRCGDFTVTSTKFENKSQYVLKKLSIQNDKKGDSKTVYHFQYTKWRNEHKVADSAADFVHFVKEVEKYIGESDTPHIVVHCLNGYERSGLFCVVYKLLEKLEAERQVSVVNIVRKIRTQRKFAVSSVEQLKFCYQCISAYLESYNTYSNFAV